MDQQTTYEVEQQLLDELLRNGRVIEHPTFGEIKLQRPTAKKERLIAAIRQKTHHRDLQARNEDGSAAVLSRAQLEKMGVERGVWSEENQLRLAWLKDEVGRMMVLLESMGFKTQANTLIDYQMTVNKLMSLYPSEDIPALEAIIRYYDLDSDMEPSDMKIIRDSAVTTEADDLIEELGTFRTLLEYKSRLHRAQAELHQLTAMYVRLTQDSIESRYERAEVLAQIYYCATKADGEPIWPKFEEAEDANAYDIEILREELYFFWAGYDKSLRDMMGKHGFTVRVPENIYEESSDASPEHPSSSSDGESPDSKP